MPSETDPTTVRSIAVKTVDLVAALEMNQTTGDHAVLRLTPPFSGRMRARLHVEQGTEDGDADDGKGADDGEGADDEPRPVHVDPAQLVANPPAYPRPDETADELRADPDDTYTVGRHHDYHAEAVSEWRHSVPDAVREQITLATRAGSHELEVALLGDL